MKYLLDTNTVTYYLEGRPAVVEHLESTRARDRYLCLITVGEIYHGIYFSTRVQRNLGRYRAFFRGVKTLPFTHAVAEQFGHAKADLQRKGLLIEDHDLWIASHALAHRATLVTGNERDFARIEGLKIENWLG
ncbi:MAG: PIN domain-containing protein [Verrucomicrobia bacterium]|nr:PIN domain-containing protein [Verrucomicrobiota bacterium]